MVDSESIRSGNVLVQSTHPDISRARNVGYIFCKVYVQLNHARSSTFGEFT